MTTGSALVKLMIFAAVKHVKSVLNYYYMFLSDIKLTCDIGLLGGSIGMIGSLVVFIVNI